MNLEEMTVEQLKALGFDLINQIEVAKHNLSIIQQAIINKEQDITKE